VKTGSAGKPILISTAKFMFWALSPWPGASQQNVQRNQQHAIRSFHLCAKGANDLARARRSERANPHQLTRRMAGRISRFELARQASYAPSLQSQCRCRWHTGARWIDRSGNRILFTLVPLDSLLDPHQPAFKLSTSHNLGVPFLLAGNVPYSCHHGAPRIRCQRPNAPDEALIQLWLTLVRANGVNPSGTPYRRCLNKQPAKTYVERGLLPRPTLP
jgi:hypothetical protein